MALLCLQRTNPTLYRELRQLAGERRLLTDIERVFGVVLCQWFRYRSIKWAEMGQT